MDAVLDLILAFGAACVAWMLLALSLRLLRLLRPQPRYRWTKLQEGEKHYQPGVVILAKYKDGTMATTDPQSLGSKSKKERIVFFSKERFVSDICKDACCLICGAVRGSKEFNKEHILPRWILRRYKLFDQKIRLPNYTDITYGKYTIPCCRECNSIMGEVLESPISRALVERKQGSLNRFQELPLQLILNWMALLFVKTHLKDGSLPEQRNTRAGTGSIGDRCNREGLHHAHCLARLFWSGVILADLPSSIFVLPALCGDGIKAFDYHDISFAQTLMIRLDDVCIIAVLNDACAVVNVLEEHVRRITAPLSPLQIRELLARCAHVNLSLRYRPRFASSMDGGRVSIIVERPDEIVIDKRKRHLYGLLLATCIEPVMYLIPKQEHGRIVPHLLRGKWSFLFDINGTFHSNAQPRAGSADVASQPSRLLRKGKGRSSH